MVAENSCMPPGPDRLGRTPGATQRKGADVAAPIERDDEGRHDDAPPPGPSPREVRRRWAEEGDVQALLDLIRTKPWSIISVGEQLQNLRRACEVRAKSDPEGYARELFGLMIGFNSFLLLRTQVYVEQWVVGRGPTPCTPTLVDFPREVVERLLPRLQEMQRGLGEMLAAEAASARLWSLTRAKEAKAAAAARGPSPHARTPGGKAARSGREAAGAEGKREVVVPLPARGRRRG